MRQHLEEPQLRPVNSFPSLHDTEMERKFSGTLVSTYDYRQMVYPNSQPFRRDLDRKLTTLEYEQPNEYYSKTMIDPTPQERNQHICFNLCCILILLAGIVSLSLCIYSLTSVYSATSSSSSFPHLVPRNYPS